MCAVIHLQAVRYFYQNITPRKINGINCKNVGHVGVHGETTQSNSAF